MTYLINFYDYQNENYNFIFYKNKILMKTLTQFRTPIKRHHTIGPEQNVQIQSPRQNKLRKLRVRTVTSMTQNHQQTQSQHLRSFAQDSLINIKLNLKTPRNIDRYEEQSQNLITQFSVEWEKMSSVKRQTYSKLRNKFVKKFPSFRQKYKQQQIDQLQPLTSIRETQLKVSKSLSKPTIELSIRGSISKIKPTDPLKKAYFYSRSKKKCLENLVEVGEIKQHNQQVPIPKISYITYVKNLKQRKKLYTSHKIKGNYMMKSRDKILGLQKQGTKSYNSLKQCLQDAIQVCITGK